MFLIHFFLFVGKLSLFRPQIHFLKGSSAVLTPDLFQFFKNSACQSSGRYITGKDSLLSCGLPLHPANCFFSRNFSFLKSRWPMVDLNGLLELYSESLFLHLCQVGTACVFQMHQGFRFHAQVSGPFGVTFLYKVLDTGLISFIRMQTFSVHSTSVEDAFFPSLNG